MQMSARQDIRYASTRAFTVIFSSLQGSNTTQQPPTYRSFELPESLEGTNQSMSKVKGRGPNAVPAYMPTVYNYQSMTSSSLQGQSRGMVRLDELDAEEPAQYDEPTQSELDRSQTIPKDMVRAVREAGAGQDVEEEEEEEGVEGRGTSGDSRASRPGVDDDASTGRKLP